MDPMNVDRLDNKGQGRAAETRIDEFKNIWCVLRFGRKSVFSTLINSRFLTEEWRGSDRDFLYNAPAIVDAVRFAFKNQRVEEKQAALQALRLVLLMTEGPYLDIRSSLEHLAGERSAVTTLALEVLALDLWLSGNGGTGMPAIDKAMELCLHIKDSQRAFGLLSTTKSSEDLVDMVLPHASGLVDRFLEAEGSEKVELGWTICGLFCALKEARGSDYDPAEVEGFINVGEFSEALRNVKPLREVADMFDSGIMPAESLMFNQQKVVFQGFRHVLQVRFLRSLLGVSFATQMGFNPRLQDLLDYNAEKAVKVKLSAVEKRLGKSPNSPDARNASKDKKKNRERKTAQTAFAGDDE